MYRIDFISSDGDPIMKRRATMVEYIHHVTIAALEIPSAVNIPSLDGAGLRCRLSVPLRNEAWHYESKDGMSYAQGI